MVLILHLFLSMLTAEEEVVLRMGRVLVRLEAVLGGLERAGEVATTEEGDPMWVAALWVVGVWTAVTMGTVLWMEVAAFLDRPREYTHGLD